MMIMKMVNLFLAADFGVLHFLDFNYLKGLFVT